MAKSKKKNVVTSLVIIAVVVIAAATILSYLGYRKSSEYQLNNANTALTNIATETGLVDKSDGTSYITLYVTAGFIVLAGIAVFYYVYKKAEE